MAVQPKGRATEGWSRPSSCPWASTDSAGNLRCSYLPLREHLRVLEAARFTVFNQGFIDEAVSAWQRSVPHPRAGECSRATCPSGWTRFANSLHRNRR